jgi:hypothetical protein
LLIVATSCAAARADVIVLRGGGEIQGKVIADPNQEESVQVLLLTGRKPLTFQKKQILQVIPKASPLDGYLVKKQQAGPSALAQFDLGLWCEQNQLADLARVHYEAALATDPNFEPAHKKLGHVRHGDRWISLDEARKVQGLVKYRGKWISEEEREKREESAQATAAQQSWVRRIKVLRQSLVAGTTERQREAETELMQIREPGAVVALAKVLGNDDPPLRFLLAHVLGNIPGKESSRALVNMILAETEDNIRGAVLDQLKQRDDPGIVPQLLKALRSENVKVINRAAWTLGNLNAVTAVPHLVGVLVSTEERMVMVGGEGEGQTPSVAGNIGPGPALMAMNKSSLAYLTGPAMAPGAVAYGAVSVPFYSPSQVLGGGVLGVGGGAAGRGPVPQALTFAYQNTEVLAALTKLTGQDFGYDDAAWRRWIKTSFNPNPTPVRQVPQP